MRPFEASIPLFDVVMRETAYQRNRELLPLAQALSPTSLNPSDPEAGPARAAHGASTVRALDGELRDSSRAGLHPARDRGASDRGEIR